MGFLFDQYWVPNIAILGQLLPFLAYFRVRPRRPALTFLAIELGISFVTDVVEAYLGSHGRNNLWVSHLYSPLEGFLILWSFSYWQSNRTAAMAVRAAAALYGALAIVLEVTVEQVHRFPVFVYPIQSLLVLAVASFVLGTKARQTTAPLVRQDWFWISIAWCLFQAATIVVQPLGNMLLDAHSNLLLPLFTLRSGLEFISFLLMAVGMFVAARYPITTGEPT